MLVAVLATVAGALLAVGVDMLGGVVAALGVVGWPPHAVRSPSSAIDEKRTRRRIPRFDGVCGCLRSNRGIGVLIYFPSLSTCFSSASP
jgi:hypothetical protein